jgi:hypothetical protein
MNIDHCIDHSLNLPFGSLFIGPSRETIFLGLLFEADAILPFPYSMTLIGIQQKTI